jgi:hypothetical protein
MVHNGTVSLEIANVASPDDESPIISIVVSHGQIHMKEMVFVLLSQMLDRLAAFHSMSCTHPWRIEPIRPLDCARGRAGIARAVVRGESAVREALETNV